MNVALPELALVVLLGPAEARARFARVHFDESEVVAGESPDGDAVVARLAAGKLTVLDTALDHQALRAPWVSRAKRAHCRPVAVLLGGPGAPSPTSLEREGFRRVHVIGAAEVTVPAGGGRRA